MSDQTDNWGPIRSTIGVANLVRFGMRAAHVPSSLIEMMQTHEEDGVQTLEQPEYKAGDRVRIVEGVMAGYEAIFQAKTGKERVLLLLQFAEDKTARIQNKRGRYRACQRQAILDSQRLRPSAEPHPGRTMARIAVTVARTDD